MRTYFRGLQRRTSENLMRRGPALLGDLSGLSRRKAEERLAKRKDDGINPKKRDEAAILRDLAQPATEESFREGAQQAMRSIGSGVVFNLGDPVAQQWLGDRLDLFSREVAGTTFDEIDRVLRAGFAEGQPLPVIADTLRQKFESFDKYRAPLIARTEAMSALNQGSIEGVRQSGAKDRLRKVWLTAADEWVRPSHAQAGVVYAKAVPIDDLFLVGADKMIAPGQGSRPEENINCRCTVAYVEGRRAAFAPEPPTPVATPAGPAKPVKPAGKPKKVGMDIGDDVHRQSYGVHLRPIERIPYTVKTAEDLEKAMWERTRDHPLLRDCVFDFKAYNLDGDLLRETLNEWIKLANEFPEVAANCKYMGGASKQALNQAGWGHLGDYFAKNANVTAAATHDITIMNPDMFGVVAEKGNRLRGSHNAGAWAGIFAKSGMTDDVAAVISHEFGHSVQWFWMGETNWPYKQGVRSMLIDNPLMHRRVKALRSLWTEWEEFYAVEGKQTITNQLSSYASTNAAEFFAEAFQDWWFNKEYGTKMTEYGRVLGEMIQQAQVTLRGK